MSLTSLKELMVLGVVQEHPMHGYALAALLSESMGWTLGLNKSAIYAILRRLEKHDLVTQTKSKDTNYPERQTYQVTDKAERAASGLLADCAGDSLSPVLPLAAALMHLDMLPETDRSSLLRQLRAWRIDQLKILDGIGSHEGIQKVALELISNQLRLELTVVEQLLAEEANQ